MCTGGGPWKSTQSDDLGKTVFHLVGLNAAGEVVVRRKFSRPQLLRFTVNLRVRRIGMEACGGSHFLGRSLREQGHDVRLMPAQYVKPYVKTNKNDYIEGGRQPGTLPSSDGDSRCWTADGNCGRGRHRQRRRASEGTLICRMAGPGTGTAINRRKQKLLGISKRGNSYLRRLLVRGARAVLQCRDKQPSDLNAWLGQLAARAHTNIVAIALANKMARIAWAVLSKGEAYRLPLLGGSAVGWVCN